MSDDCYWRKIKKDEFTRVEKLLKDNENNYVNACAKFIARKEVNTLFWVLCGKEEIQSLLINSKSNILPVLCGVKIPAIDLKRGFLPSKKIHSVQGLKNEVIIIENELSKNGWKAKEIIDYELMSLDVPPQKGKNLSGFSNLVLRKPVMTDIDAMAPLQAGYEKEEVLPKGSTFSPAASRSNLSNNIIAKGQVLAADINGRLIGKINVSGISFTRYQVGGVYVHPDFRGRGIGRRMAYEFISSLISEGRGVTLFVRKTNTSARRLYLSLGFTVINDYRISYY